MTHFLIVYKFTYILLFIRILRNIGGYFYVFKKFKNVYRWINIFGA